jgi:hypothetical protein
MLIACGGEDDPPPVMEKCEKAGGAACFLAPAAVAKKANGMPANFNCQAPVVMTSTQAISISGVIEDFQNNEPVDNATIEAFDDLDFSAPVAMANAMAPDAAFTLNIPSGMAKSRMNFRMKAPNWLDTYALNIAVDINNPTITGMTRNAVSVATATALPAFIGVERTEGLGVLAGVAVDCDGDELEGVIATVSSTSSKSNNAAPTFVAGAQVYYFSNGDPDLPVRRTSQTSTNKDGLFVIIEIPPTSGSSTYFLQTWAFTSEADVADGLDGLTLLSELESPVVGDSVISVEMNPNVQ